MYHLLSEMLLFHDSDTGLKSRSRKTQASFTTDLWWQWKKRCSKLDFHYAAVSFLGYCTCDVCCPHSPSSTQTRYSGALACHFQLCKVAQLPSPPPSTQLLWLWEAPLNWEVDTLMHSLEALLSPSTCTFSCIYGETGKLEVKWGNLFPPALLFLGN